MSDRDVLDEAFAALRAETTASSSDDAARAAATRRQLLLAAAAQQRRRSRMLRFVLPLAAALAAGTAWAAVTGRLGELVSPSPLPAPSATATLSPPPWLPEPPASASASPSASPSASASASASAPAPASASASAPSHTDDRETTLYRSAHQAHFVARNPSDALVAWDAYLNAYPSGRFAPEARYNRALMLIRLGRTAEARTALRSFADAPPGSYRQAEARALLDATQ